MKAILILSLLMLTCSVYGGDPYVIKIRYFLQNFYDVFVGMKNGLVFRAATFYIDYPECYIGLPCAIRAFVDLIKWFRHALDYGDVLERFMGFSQDIFRCLQSCVIPAIYDFQPKLFFNNNTIADRALSHLALRIFLPNIDYQSDKNLNLFFLETYILGFAFGMGVSHRFINKSISSNPL